MDFNKDTPQDRVNNRQSLSQVARSTPTTRYNSRPNYRGNYYRSSPGAGFYGAVAVMVVVVASLIVGYVALHPERDITVKVTDKVRTGGDDSKYLIFTDGGVYEDTDTMMKGKYNSSDLYSKIKVGQRYTFHLRGVRSGFFSMYPNILTVKPVK